MERIGKRSRFSHNEQERDDAEPDEQLLPESGRKTKLGVGNIDAPANNQNAKERHEQPSQVADDTLGSSGVDRFIVPDPGTTLRP